MNYAVSTCRNLPDPRKLQTWPEMQISPHQSFRSTMISPFSKMMRLWKGRP